MSRAPHLTRLPEVTAEDEAALATARIGNARYVLESVHAELHGGTVVVTVTFRGQAAPLVLRVARGKARMFGNELDRILAE
jgi:hypothetical protein